MDATACTTLWCDYVHTQFDPAHLFSELGFTLAFEIVQIIGIAFLWRKIIKPRLVKATHEEIDRQHNIEHE